MKHDGVGPWPWRRALWQLNSRACPRCPAEHNVGASDFAPGRSRHSEPRSRFTIYHLPDWTRWISCAWESGNVLKADMTRLHSSMAGACLAAVVSRWVGFSTHACMGGFHLVQGRRFSFSPARSWAELAVPTLGAVGRNNVTDPARCVGTVTGRACCMSSRARQCIVNQFIMFIVQKRSRILRQHLRSSTSRVQKTTPVSDRDDGASAEGKELAKQGLDGVSGGLRLVLISKANRPVTSAQ
ncbi:hypothetical protein LX32DRAFT_45181 [Colletotrichum zoysiae]|uniref:Uncharacterized protein n=1 Tax=Colletotrichum zoysiae TaxID=1216348 RepID=A0AAD9HCJ5_9PEZI|nr:hypothetical protein LX32DRAFT_45181 [Colletotrichum zoysiae]